MSLLRRQFVAAALILFLLGGHWLTLQTMAWVSMVASFSNEVPVGRALVWTLDGDHPCELCLVVSEGKTSDKKAKRFVVKYEMVLDGARLELFPPRLQPLVLQSEVVLSHWDSPPPLPPPIS